MEEKRKLVVDIPKKLDEKIDRTKEEQMITKSALVKLAVNQYCDLVLKDNGSTKPNI